MSADYVTKPVIRKAPIHAALTLTAIMEELAAQAQVLPVLAALHGVKGYRVPHLLVPSIALPIAESIIKWLLRLLSKFFPALKTWPRTLFCIPQLMREV